MKMKLFKHVGAKTVQNIESEVNKWLEKNPNVEIREIKQSTSGGSWADTKVYITIWYD
ncbi:MAG: hypothetical protein GY936_02305 [Ignavibacteriae bacterium]|nr:hypothetical protein [Ignavibacteriota bacterium]